MDSQDTRDGRRWEGEGNRQQGHPRPEGESGCPPWRLRGRATDRVVLWGTSRSRCPVSSRTKRDGAATDGAATDEGAAASGLEGHHPRKHDLVGFPCRWPVQTAPGGPARHAPKPRPTSRSASHAESWRRDDHTAETRRQSEVWMRCALNSRSPRAGLPNGRAPRDHERRLVPDRRGEERPQGGGPVLGLGNGDSWCVAGSNGVVRLGR